MTSLSKLSVAWCGRPACTSLEPYRCSKQSAIIEDHDVADGEFAVLEN